MKKVGLSPILIAVVVFAVGVIAEAQQGKVYRVGVLVPPGKSEEQPRVRGLRDGLKDAGYIEGKNLQLNIPNVKTYDELRPIANRYVEEKIDVIVTDGGTATGIAKGGDEGDPHYLYLGFTRSCASRSCEVSGTSGDKYYRFDLQPRSRNFR